MNPLVWGGGESIKFGNEDHLPREFLGPQSLGRETWALDPSSHALLGPLLGLHLVLEGSL